MVWPHVRAALESEVLSGPRLRHVTVSGHSLGAAVATLVSYAAQRFLDAHDAGVMVSTMLVAAPNGAAQWGEGGPLRARENQHGQAAQTHHCQTHSKAPTSPPLQRPSSHPTTPLKNKTQQSATCASCSRTPSSSTRAASRSPTTSSRWCRAPARRAPTGAACRRATPRRRAAGACRSGRGEARALSPARTPPPPPSPLPPSPASRFSRCLSTTHPNSSSLTPPPLYTTQPSP